MPNGYIGDGEESLIYKLSGMKKSRNKPWQETEYRDRPWLAEPAWQTGKIVSTAKAGGRMLWGFAIFWNLLSTPVLFTLPRELARGNYPALIGVFAPIVGLGLLVTAIVQTRRWRRFGKTPFEMDPFPGRLGGHVGGHIEIKLPYRPETQFEINLTCAYSYISGSGKNRGRREKILWQDKQIINAQPGIDGSRLDIMFSVPPDFPASEQPGDAYHKWTLSVEAQLDGPDYSRQFEIPVFAGDGPLSTLDSDEEASGIVTPFRERGGHLDPTGVENILAMRHSHDGVQWRYPAWRYPSMSILLFLFGLIFAGVSIFIAMEAMQDLHSDSTFDLVIGVFSNSIGIFMTVVFGLVGTGMALAGIYTAGNSLTLVLQIDQLHSQRRLFGLPIRYKQVPLDMINAVDKKIISSSSSGSRHTVNYRVFARTADQKKYTLAENLPSASEADAVIHYFREKFRLL
ncbi:MAG: hypothetical protein ACE5GZ_07905 [Gammaproteobacteria bacterium]